MILQGFREIRKRQKLYKGQKDVEGYIRYVLKGKHLKKKSIYKIFGRY